jgi:hypothetical protein
MKVDDPGTPSLGIYKQFRGRLCGGMESVWINGLEYKC